MEVTRRWEAQGASEASVLTEHDVPCCRLQVASMMPSDEAEAPLEYQKGSIGAIADRWALPDALMPSIA